MYAYVELVAATVAYALGLIAQAVAAQRAERRDRVDPGLLARLARDRLYIAGFGCQSLGFVLAFLARGNLPLYLVQAALAGSTALAAILGAIALGWRVRVREFLALSVIACGVAVLAAGAVPSRPDAVGTGLQWGLVVMVLAVMLVAIPAGRLVGSRSAVIIGAFSGVSFGVVAIASRPLAAGPVADLPLSPMFWLIVLAVAVGQTLFAAALQRGSATSASAAMTAVATVVASLTGLLVLGDKVRNGWAPLVGLGLSLVVAGVIWLAAASRMRSRVDIDDGVHGLPDGAPEGGKVDQAGR